MKTKQMSDLRLKKMAELAGGGRILDVGFAERPNKYLHGTVIGFDIMNGQRPRLCNMWGNCRNVRQCIKVF